ncbi:acyltransferase [Lysobacter sp. 2RAF19]
MTNPNEAANWKQRPEGGNRFAIQLIRAIARRGGRVIARLCLYPIVLYFLALRGPERRASRSYLTRVLRKPATLLGVARHFHTFAATILDRVFLLGEDLRRFDVRVHGLEHLHSTVDQHGGVLLFGSHLGSFEVMRVLARERPDIPVRVVLDKAHNAAMTQLLDALNPEIAATVIDAGQDGPSIVLEIQHAIAEGAVVALLVDRTQPGEPGYPVEFLGAPAQMPGAPWLIAAVLHAPVVLAFGLYRGGNRYDLMFEPFSGPIKVARKDRNHALADMARRYAARLEHHARSAPYNWFNFYDFWQAPTGAPVDDKPQTRPQDESDARPRAAGGDVGGGTMGRAA